MSTEISLDLDADYSMLEFARSVGVRLPVDWEGREVTLKELSDCKEDIEQQIMDLFESAMVGPETFNQLVYLARAGIAPEDRDFFERDIQRLISAPEGIYVTQAGLFKSVSKLWHKHKKAIIIGAAVVAIVVAVVVVVACTGGAGAEIAGAAGGAALKSLTNTPKEQERKSLPEQPAASTPAIEEKPEFAEFNPQLIIEEYNELIHSRPLTDSASAPFLDLAAREYAEINECRHQAFKEAVESLRTGREIDVTPGAKQPDNYAASAYHGCYSSEYSSSPPFQEIPIIGYPDQSTVHFHCGINNDVSSISEGGKCLYDTLNEGFAIQPHLINSSNIAKGLAMVALEKVESLCNEVIEAAPIVSNALGLAVRGPGAILKNSHIQKAIDYEAENLSNIAQRIIKRNDPTLKQVHVTFSNGGYVFNEALKRLSSEYRDTIIVIPVGTTAIIDANLAHKVYNVIGDQDEASIRCNWPLAGLKDALEVAENANIEIIPQKEVDGILGGHYFQQFEYQDKIKTIINKEIVSKYEIY